MYKSKWLSLLLVFAMMFLSVAPQVTLAASSNNSEAPAAQKPSAYRPGSNAGI